MLEIVFLGTSASAPSEQRGLPATLILYKDRRFLIDAGEGTQRQILRSGMGFRRLDTVLLTHGHLDHILGLGGIASTFARFEAAEQLTVYGGKWALDRVRDLMAVVMRGEDLGLKVRYVALQAGLILEAGDLELVAFPVHHRGSGNFGFLFQERSHRPFLVEQAEALGVPAGPERRDLVRGQAVTLADGRVIQPEAVLGPMEPGVRLVFIGDAARVDDLAAVARNADTLICESTYLWADRDAARQFGHLTARQAAELALESAVGTLILTHISRRYATREVLAEARAIFPATYVAADMDHYAVRRGGASRVIPEG